MTLRGHVVWGPRLHHLHLHNLTSCLNSQLEVWRLNGPAVELTAWEALYNVHILWQQAVLKNLDIPPCKHHIPARLSSVFTLLWITPVFSYYFIRRIIKLHFFVIHYVHYCMYCITLPCTIVSFNVVYLGKGLSKR